MHQHTTERAKARAYKKVSYFSPLSSLTLLPLLLIPVLKNLILFFELTSLFFSLSCLVGLLSLNMSASTPPAVTHSTPRTSRPG